MTTQRQLAKMRNRPTREIASERAENAFLKSQSMPIPSTGQGQGRVISRGVVAYGDSASLIPTPRPLLLLVQVAGKIDAAVLLGTRLYSLQGLRLRDNKRFS